MSFQPDAFENDAFQIGGVVAVEQATTVVRWPRRPDKVLRGRHFRLEGNVQVGLPVPLATLEYLNDRDALMDHLLDAVLLDL